MHHGIPAEELQTLRGEVDRARAAYFLAEGEIPEAERGLLLRQAEHDGGPIDANAARLEESQGHLRQRAEAAL